MCDCGNVFVSKKCVSVCPKCSASVHIHMAACSTCGYVFSHDKPCPIRESKCLGMQRKRALESNDETLERKAKNQRLMSSKRASETVIEKNARHEANKTRTANARASEPITKTAARREADKTRIANVRASEPITKTATRCEANKTRIANARASEPITITAARREANKTRTTNARASEPITKTAARREADKNRTANARASESIVQSLQRKKQDKMYKISKRTATVTIDSAISNFLGKIRQGPDYVCTCCHRMMYKQNVISYNIHKYTKCSTDVLENVFAEESNYTCSNGKQWVCKTCDGALTRGNNPVQAKANGFKLPSIPPEFSSLNSLDV